MSRKKSIGAMIVSEEPSILQSAAQETNDLAVEGDAIDVKFDEAKQDYFLSLKEQLENKEKTASTVTTYKSNLNRYSRWLDAALDRTVLLAFKPHR